MKPNQSPNRRTVGWLVALIGGTVLTVSLSAAVWAMWPTVSAWFTAPTTVTPPEDASGSSAATTTTVATGSGISASGQTASSSTTSTQTAVVTSTTIRMPGSTTAQATTTTKKATTTTKPVTKPTVRPTAPSLPSDDDPADHVVSLGNPNQSNRVPVSARSPWDMIVVGDSLYVGGGDYGVDSGPTTIWRYDITDKQWNASAVVQDEAVLKFMTVDGTVLAPGTDPTTNTWEWGNYHELTGETWTTIDNLPDAVHNYDIVSFAGQTFFAIGTYHTRVSPVKVTTDRKTYTDVPFYIDGVDIRQKALGEYYRVVEFFVAGDSLYCVLYSHNSPKSFWGFFRYEEGAFHFVSKVADNKLEYGNFWTDAFGPSVTFRDTCYFTTKKLYKTTDFETIRQVDMPDGGIVTDLLVETGEVFGTETMYVLSTVEQSDGRYQNTIWRYVETDRFIKVADFSTNVEAFSFAKYQNTFFVGLGRQGATHEDTGTILQIHP